MRSARRRWLGACALAVQLACSSSPADDADGRDSARPDEQARSDGGADLQDGSRVTPGTDAENADAAAGDAAVAPIAAPEVCAASAEGSRKLGEDVFVANTGKLAVSALTYENVGAAGSYAEVVSGWSKATGCQGDSDGTLCKTTYRKPKQVAGPLAPFNEELTLVFAGPTELYRIGVYQPAGERWERSAYWDRCSTQGLVFAGNKSWYECGGFVESYVTADGKAESDSPVQFSGSVSAGVEVHVNASALCASAAECGYSTGLPLHGFAGDSAGAKLFAVELRMPIGTSTPAYWILPSQVIRSSQYGCNCRGAGSDPTYKGGCGELDVAEILGGVTTSLEATTTLYSFQDITGGGSVAFARPVQEAATFVVILDADSRQIAIRRLGTGAFDFASALTRGEISALLQDAGTLRTLK